MLGGAWFTPGLGDPDKISHAALLQRAQAAVKEHLGILAEPFRTIVKVQKVCILELVRQRDYLLEALGATGWEEEVFCCQISLLLVDITSKGRLFIYWKPWEP